MLVFENCEIDLENTFHCGQTFRWKRREDGSFAGNVIGRAVRAQVRDGALCLPGAAEEDVRIWEEQDDGRSRYEGELFCNSVKYEFEIDPQTGRIYDWNADLRE